MFLKKTLVDLGCSSSYISQRFIQENNLNTQKLLFSITYYNTNNSTNRNRSVTETIEMYMIIGDYEELIQLSMTNIENYDIFLRYNWS